MNLKTAALEKSSRSEYFNIAVSVDCVIFAYFDKALHVLLMESDLKEFEGLNSLLGDLVRPDEDLEGASYRILKEKTGMHDVYLEQVHTFGAVNRHPSGRVITTAYFSLLNIKKFNKQPAIEKKLQWHNVASIKKMAFDHRMILDKCLQQLQERIMEYPIVFNLLPEKFSLRELQDLYEAILGVDLDRRNFRKRLMSKSWLADTHEMEDDVPHRPGKLYSVVPSCKRKIKSENAALVLN